MSFLIFPLLLAGALAAAGAAIPVIIHLLHRQRVQPVLWGAMQFLKLSPLQQKRRKKIEHWLLLLMRIAVMVLLVFLLAWPRKDRKWDLLATTGGTDIAIVIDHSLSTGRRSGDSTVFQKSVSAVEQLARAGKIKGGDSLSVVLAEHQPRKLTPRPLSSGEMDRLVGDLRRLKPGLSDASIPDAVAAAREVLSHGRNTRKVVVVLSDEQRVGWKVNDMTAWNAAVGLRVKGVEPDMKVYDVPVLPDAQVANVSVTSLTVTPADRTSTGSSLTSEGLLGAGRPAAITASVVNKGSRDAPACTVHLIANGKQVAQQSLPQLAPEQSRTIRFDYTFNNLQSNWVQVQVDASDALEADNSAVAATYVWPNIPVLVIDGQLSGLALDPTGSVASVRSFKNSRFLLNAMLSDAANPDAPALLRPTVISALDQKLNTMKLDDFAAIVVNDVPRLPGALMSKLPDYAKSGHGVWFIFGKNTDRDFISAPRPSDSADDRARHTLATSGLFQLEVKDRQGSTPGGPDDAAPTLDVKDATNPMVEMFAATEHNALAGVRTYRWWSLASHSPDAKAIVAVAGSDDPLILERPIGSNGGRVVVWATSADGAWSNWPTTKMFAPLVNETAYQLAAGQTRGMENRRLSSGQSIVWTGPASPPIARAEITLPDGSKVERRPPGGIVTRDGRQVIVFDRTYLPGRYELRFDQSAIPQPIYYGVGLDPAELDPTMLSGDDQKWLTHEDHKFVQERLDPGSELTAILASGDGDLNFTWLCVAGCVLAALLFETWLTMRLIRRQAGPAGADALLGAPRTAAA